MPNLENTCQKHVSTMEKYPNVLNIGIEDIKTLNRRAGCVGAWML